MTQDRERRWERLKKKLFEAISAGGRGAHRRAAEQLGMSPARLSQYRTTSAVPPDDVLNTMEEWLRASPDERRLMGQRRSAERLVNQLGAGDLVSGTLAAELAAIREITSDPLLVWALYEATAAGMFAEAERERAAAVAEWARSARTRSAAVRRVEDAAERERAARLREEALPVAPDPSRSRPDKAAG